MRTCEEGETLCMCTPILVPVSLRRTRPAPCTLHPDRLNAVSDVGLTLSPAAMHRARDLHDPPHNDAV